MVHYHRIRMKIVFLGASGYPRSLTERSMCVFLPEHGVLLDAGAGLASLPDHPAFKERSEFSLLLSHFHIDHLVGLFYCLPHLASAKKRLTIYADERVGELGRLIQEPFFSSIEGGPAPISALPLAERLTIAGLTVTVRRFPHATGWTNGFRITDGKTTVVYITDTTANPEQADFARGADLLLHECNYPNRRADQAKAEGHSYSDVVAAFAKAAGAKRFLLTHIESPFRDEVLAEVKQKFPSVERAEDGLAIGV